MNGIENENSKLSEDAKGGSDIYLPAGRCRLAPLLALCLPRRLLFSVYLLRLLFADW